MAGLTRKGCLVSTIPGKHPEVCDTACADTRTYRFPFDADLILGGSAGAGAPAVTLLRSIWIRDTFEWVTPVPPLLGGDRDAYKGYAHHSKHEQRETV